MEKAYKHKLKLVMIFMDFQRAVDRIKGNKLIKAMIHIKPEHKILRLREIRDQN